MEDLSQPSSSNNPPEVFTPQSPARCSNKRRRRIQTDESEIEEIPVEPEFVRSEEVSEEIAQVLPEPVESSSSSTSVIPFKKAKINYSDNSPSTSNGSKIVNKTKNLEERQLSENEREWKPIIKPTRFPYIAQIGDMIVYMKQGHQLYINEVKERNLFRITSKMLPR